MSASSILRSRRLLLWTRLLHTAIWAVMASSIALLPVFALTRHFSAALGVTVLISLEGVALGLAGGVCPLSAVARRFTDDSSPTFDIFLPVFIARWNKEIFGTLFAVGEAFTLFQLVRLEERSALSLQVTVLILGAAASALAFWWWNRRQG